MRKMIFLLATHFLLLAASAQLTILPDGGNKKAWVGERIGITDVMIEYNRPAVKGREGKIWGQLIPAGFNDLGFGTSKEAPWRAGANENTTISFSTDVMIEGKPLRAGKYGFFIAWDSQEPTVIFSTTNSAWGSFFYDEKKDALRLKVKAMPMNSSVEWLKYEFLNQQENSATIALEWEKIMIPFTVTVDYVQTQLQSFRNELIGEKGLNQGWKAFQQAAKFTADRNVDLEEGLVWADNAISMLYVGEANFETLSTKAAILAKLNRDKEAEEVMKQALTLGTMQQVHIYGRQLLQEKKNRQALEIFQLNYKNNPGQFTTYTGLARGYSANGDFKNALKYAQLALPLSPNEPNKKFLLDAIEKLKQHQDIN